MSRLSLPDVIGPQRAIAVTELLVDRVVVFIVALPVTYGPNALA